jgi:regulator of RNase E activity RraA
VQIRAGDVIVMDDSGVVAIPIESAEEVLAHATAIARREERIAELIRQGQPLSVAFAIPKSTDTN